MLIAVNSKFQGKVEDPSQWATFNDSFENMDIDPIEAARHIWRGHSIAPCHAHERHEIKQPGGGVKMSAYRHHLNWMPTGYVGLDFDKGDVGFDSLLRHEFIEKYGTFLYTTQSHTEDDPRSRVIFVLDEPITDKAFYGQAATFLTELFDLSDASCKDVVRIFFGSPRCEVYFNRNESGELRILPLAVLRHEVHKWRDRKERENEKRRANARRNFTPQTESEKLERAQELLEHIDGYSIDYLQWYAVIAVLTNEFGPATAEALVESWAPGYPGEVAKKIRSITEVPRSASLGKLYYLARENGYVPIRRKKWDYSSQDDRKRWVEEQAEELIRMGALG